MIQYFPKPYEPFGGDINVIVDLTNYVTKADLKNGTGIDTSKLALTLDLANLKAEVDKIDIDKLKTVLVDLSKLSNIVKKTVYDKLNNFAKVNNTDISRFVLKINYGTDKSKLEKKFLILADFLKN